MLFVRYRRRADAAGIYLYFTLARSEKMEKITTDMLMGEIVRNYDGAIEVLEECGMGCVGCPASQAEPLMQAAMVHGLDADEIASVLNTKLNLA